VLNQPDETEPVKVSRLGGRSARVRAAVHAAAIEILTEHGIDGLSISEVSRRSKVHESSIYRRWKTKDNLIVEAVLSRVNVELIPPDTGSLREDLLSLLRDVAAFIATPIGMLVVQLTLRKDMAESAAAREKFRADRFVAGTAVLERATARADLRPGIDHRLALETLIGPLYIRLLVTGEPVTDGYLESIIDLVLAGIARRD
jgi:AcrR family transcriptional regulator